MEKTGVWTRERERKFQTEMKQVIVAGRRGSAEMKSSDSKILEAIHKIETNIRQEIKDSRDELRLDLKREVEDLKNTIKDVTKEVKVLDNKVKQLENKTEKLDKITQNLTRTQEYEKEMYKMREFKDRKKCIKIRGLKERQNENLYEELIPALAELVDCPKELLDLDVDKIFRISSSAARNRNLPRDVVIYFTRERVKDKIIQASYEKN